VRLMRLSVMRNKGQLIADLVTLTTCRLGRYSHTCEETHTGTTAGCKISHVCKLLLLSIRVVAKAYAAVESQQVTNICRIQQKTCHC
jgi:hypothetical protein